MRQVAGPIITSFTSITSITPITPIAIRSALLVVVISVTGTLVSPSPLAAETGDDSADGLPAASVPAQNLDRQWRVWHRQLQDGSPTIAPLQTIASNSISLGRPNPRVHLLATLHALEPGGGKSLTTPSTRIETYRTLEDLAPDLPYGPLGHAHAALDTTPSAVGEWLGAYYTGLQRAATWLNTLVSWGGRFAFALLMALLAIVAAGLVTSCFRHVPLTAYDVARLLPRGITRTQVLVGLAVITFALAFLFGSFVVGVAVLFAVASWAQRGIERVPALVFCLLLMVAPWVAPSATGAATYSGSTAQQVYHALQLGDCNESCRTKLDEASEDASPLLSAATVYARAVVHARDTNSGDLNEAERLITERTNWPAPLTPWRDQLLGAVYSAQGELSRATKLLEQARDERPESFSVHYNLMNTYRRHEATSKAADAHERAARLNPERLDRRESHGSTNVNSELIFPALPNDVVWSAHLTSLPDTTLWDSVWATVHTSNSPGDQSTLWGIGLIVILGLTWLGGFFEFASRPCPNCGGPREPADTERTGGHAYCHPCYRAFVSSGSLHHRRRVQVEQTLRRRRSRRAILHRVLSALAPGSGHLLAGFPLRGACCVAALGFGLTLLVGIAPVGAPPAALLGIDWIGWSIIGIATLGPAVLVGLLSAAYGINPYK